MKLSVLKVFMAIWPAFFLLVAFGYGENSQKPNVIVIMADDIGAEGLESYGSTIYTSPHLTQMAAEGVQFQNAYATPLCTPTRVMIMTGTYPHRNGFKALIGKRPGLRMPANIPTFGHYFQKAGYKTAIAGKWQLGKFDAFQVSQQNMDLINIACGLGFITAKKTVVITSLISILMAISFKEQKKILVQTFMGNTY